MVSIIHCNSVEITNRSLWFALTKLFRAAGVQNSVPGGPQPCFNPN